MRYQGKLTDWNDDRGFGFITPDGGGPQVFVHIKAFTPARHRPVRGERVSFALAADGKGRHRAAQVTCAGNTRRQRQASRDSGLAVALATGFLALAALGAGAGIVPRAVLLMYLAASAVGFAAYACDKSAARNGGWRVRESTLHLIGLAGGWPGALIAQRLLRHKSTKASFQLVFRATVILNCGAAGWLLSPAGMPLLQALGR